MKTYKFIQLIHFLCDALKPVTQLSLTFQSNTVDLSVIQPKIQLALATLQQLKEKPGLNTRKVPKVLETFEITPNEQQITSSQRNQNQFLDNLTGNISRRFENPEIVNAMSVFCNPDVSSLCGSEDLELLADHYSMDLDTVMEEWDNLSNMVSEMDTTQKTGPTAIIRIINQMKTTAGDFCPHVEKLCSIAAILPFSTAEVERVFSDVSRTVSDLRNRLNVESTHKLLMLHRNDKYLNITNAVRKWAGKKNRRINIV